MCIRDSYNTVVGACNEFPTAAATDTWNGGDPLFQVGGTAPDSTSGSCSTRGDAFTIFKSGDANLNGELTHTSDMRLKKDLEEISAGEIWEKIQSLGAYRYKWNDASGKDTAEVHIGAIAQNVQGVFPECVRTKSDGMMSVNYNCFGVLALSALRSIDTKNSVLEAKVEMLQDHAQILESRVEELQTQIKLIVDDLRK
eukprot:TRINITY_DN22765_c0_g1_i1.p1 TRINITY_DN22765_c0_g1~~TRINITY_DN22765_c0_g1_i1.p1  ORF type:complete len:198 (+),score=33.01 TRINITY_DN22765_c0_g1_i1:3-596(+)